MDEREVFPAFAALSSTCRAFLSTVEQAIGKAASVKLAKRDFAVNGISRGQSWSAAKTRLIRLRFIIVEAGGPSGCTTTANVYRLTDGWRSLGETDAQQLARVERRRPPRTVWLLRQLARAADSGNAEALALWQEMTGGKRIARPDAGIVSIGADRAFELGRLRRERPDLFQKADPRGKPKPQRRSYHDDAVMFRLQEAARSRPAR